MTLYCIMTAAQAGVHASDLMLQTACEQRGITYVRLICEEVVLDDLRDARYDASDLVYRISTSNKAVDIEALLTQLHPQLTTIYAERSQRYPFRNFRELSNQLTSGLSVIPTRLVDAAWSALPIADIDTRVSELGGYPVVLKQLGLSHGVGVSLIPNVTALQAAIAELPVSASAILRTYLPDYRHYRMIVVGGRTVAAIEYHKPVDDFRTNASEEPEVTAVAVDELPPETVALAEQAASQRYSLLAGVDILVDNRDDMAYLAEVNVPCYFPRAQTATGIDIAGKIVDALIATSRSQEIVS